MQRRDVGGELKRWRARRSTGTGAAAVGAKGQRLGEDLDVEAELARCSSGAPAWRCGVAAAVRALLRAEQFVEAARGFEGA